MKQIIEQRREHHQTREDRRRKVYEILRQRIAGTYRPRYGNNGPWNIEAAKRDAARLAEKLGIASG